MQDRHYFIGIKAPASLYNQAAEYIKKYSLETHYKVLPEKEDYHITLQFLGAVSNDLLPAILKTLDNIAARHSSFPIQTGGLNSFGRTDQPRVIYLNVKHSEQLCLLQKEISKAILNLFDQPLDQRFTPHITIAKKKKTKAPLLNIAENNELIDMTVSSFSLFAIHPKSSPKYEVVHSFALQ